jgi:hypothetical protein
MGVLLCFFSVVLAAHYASEELACISSISLYQYRRLFSWECILAARCLLKSEH